MNYTELKRKHAEEMNNFEGIFYAFNNEQFKKGIDKVGATQDNKVVSLGAGGYILKSKLAAFKEMFKRHEQEMKKLRQDRKKLLDSLVYELNNHDYSYTGETTDALEALGVSADELPTGLLSEATKLCSAMAIYH